MTAWERANRPKPPPINVEGWIEGYAALNQTIFVWKHPNNLGWGIYSSWHGTSQDTFAEAIAYAHKLAYERSHP